MSFDKHIVLLNIRIQHRFDIYCPVKSKCCTVSVNQIAGCYTHVLSAGSLTSCFFIMFLNQLMFWCFLSQVHMSQQRIRCISDHFILFLRTSVLIWINVNVINGSLMFCNDIQAFDARPVHVL